MVVADVCAPRLRGWSDSEIVAGARLSDIGLSRALGQDKCAAGPTSSVSLAAEFGADALGGDRREGVRKCREDSPRPQAAREMPGQNVPPPVTAQTIMRTALMRR